MSQVQRTISGMDDKTSDVESNIVRALSCSDNAVPVDSRAEKKLLRKIDVYIVPMLGLAYLLCFLDRANIGNAKTAGLTTSLNLSASQYATCVSVLYSTYVTFECVYPNLIKVLGPKVILSTACLGFGLITLATAWSANFHGLLACRILLGATEAGIFPCIVTYFAMIYRREELGYRIALMLTNAAISGAFGGLIAYGLLQISSGALLSWQWIYVVEGILSILLAPVLFLYIPNRIDQAWFLNPAEKAMCALRYQANLRNYDPDQKFDWAGIGAALTAWTTYFFGIVQFGADIALYGISTFMPVFIKDFGYTTVQSNLLTVPVYIFGAVCFVLQAHFSDKWQLRSPFIIGSFFFQLIGYVLLASIDGPSGVRYFALYVIAVGLYTPVGLNVGWCQNNNAGHYKRAMSVGLMQLIGNSSGAAIGFIFIDSPLYHRGFKIAAGLNALSIVCVVALVIHFRRQNKLKKQAVEEGAVDDSSLGDRNPYVLYFL